MLHSKIKSLQGLKTFVVRLANLWPVKGAVSCWTHIMDVQSGELENFLVKCWIDDGTGEPPKCCSRKIMGHRDLSDYGLS